MRRNETVLVDVGANLGWCAWPAWCCRVGACRALLQTALHMFLPPPIPCRYTLQAAAAGYRVIAFEPLPQNVGAIRRSLCENPHLAPLVALIPKGAGSRMMAGGFRAAQAHLQYLH